MLIAHSENAVLAEPTPVAARQRDVAVEMQPHTHTAEPAAAGRESLYSSFTREHAHAQPQSASATEAVSSQLQEPHGPHNDLPGNSDQLTCSYPAAESAHASQQVVPPQSQKNITRQGEGSPAIAREGGAPSLAIQDPQRHVAEGSGQPSRERWADVPL